MNIYLSYKFGGDWTINDLMLEMTHDLKSKYNAEVHYEYNVQQKVETFDYLLPDCEILIYEEATDTLKAITYSEHRSGLWNIFNIRNKPQDILVVLHQDGWGLRNINLNKPNFTIKNTTFYSFLPNLNMRYYYNKRRTISYENMDNRMFFGCTTGRGDEKALIEQGIINEMFPPLPMTEYLLKAIKHKVGLALPGVAELCHRDLDYMGVGLPVLRMEYAQEYSPDFIPNFHYIAVDRENLPKDSHLDLVGGPEYVEKYIGRYNEIKNDYKFLDFISKNAIEYYEENCTPHRRVAKMLEKLEL